MMNKFEILSDHMCVTHERGHEVSKCYLEEKMVHVDLLQARCNKPSICKKKKRNICEA